MGNRANLKMSLKRKKKKMNRPRTVKVPGGIEVLMKPTMPSYVKLTRSENVHMDSLASGLLVESRAPTSTRPDALDGVSTVITNV